MAGRGPDGVDKSSDSAFFIPNTRRDNTAKMISQLRSNPRSVQASIICVAVKVEVETFMDTSSLIKSIQEKCIVCHYYSKTKWEEDINSTAILTGNRSLRGRSDQNPIIVSSSIWDDVEML